MKKQTNQPPLGDRLTELDYALIYSRVRLGLVVASHGLVLTPSLLLYDEIFLKPEGTPGNLQIF